jgi:hypothetical protein
LLDRADCRRHRGFGAARHVFFSLRPEEDRYKVADETVVELRKHGQWRELDDMVEPPIGHA